MGSAYDAPPEVVEVMEGHEDADRKLDVMASYANGRRYEKRASRGARRLEARGQGLLLSRPEALDDGDQRYTVRATLALCAKIAGVEAFDLDAAACEESHKAPKFYTIADDGLKQPWFGRVWVNPPYSDVGPWVAKAWHEMRRDGEASTVAMLLPSTRSEQKWWQQQVEPFRDGRKRHAGGALLTTHNLPGRQRFGIVGNPEGVGVGSPPFGVVLLIWRRSEREASK